MVRRASFQIVISEPPGLPRRDIRWDKPTGSLPGFTLFEVVLAIGLCGAVMALLATAIDLYLVRVDTSRTQVETAQLARTLLMKIADDLRSARFSVASADLASLGGGQSSGSGQVGEQTNENNAGSSSLSTTTSTDLGIYGTLTELRIDRTAEHSWRQVMVPATEVPLDADPHDMPQTVEYFFQEGRTMAGNDLAAGGVSLETSLEGYTGLYRRRTPTAALAAASTALTGSATGTASQELAELLAPEVVQVAFMYSDGTQWFEEWDSSVQQALPTAVEITLTLFAEPPATEQPERQMDEEALRRDASRWTEYKLLVRIPKIDEPQDLTGPQSPASEDQQPPQLGGTNAP